jgi:hypothetical protein
MNATPSDTPAMPRGPSLLACWLLCLDAVPRSDTSPTRAKQDERPSRSPAAKPDHGENSASTIVEAPQKLRRRLDAHEFADGGGSGGAEAFSRKRLRR